MLQERINRVMNNHQYSCQHPGNYLFILKNFDDVLKTHTVPAAHLDPKLLHKKGNMYLTYDESLDLDPQIIEDIKKYSYRVWILDFNLFPKDDTVVEVQPDWYEARKTISVFNTINPLIGIVEDPNADHDLNKVYKDLINEVI